MRYRYPSRTWATIYVLTTPSIIGFITLVVFILMFGWTAMLIIGWFALLTTACVMATTGNTRTQQQNKSYTIGIILISLLMLLLTITHIMTVQQATDDALLSPAYKALLTRAMLIDNPSDRAPLTSQLAALVTTTKDKETQDQFTRMQAAQLTTMPTGCVISDYKYVDGYGSHTYMRPDWDFRQHWGGMPHTKAGKAKRAKEDALDPTCIDYLVYGRDNGLILHHQLDALVGVGNDR
jgi:hypothetical protein